MKVETSPVGFWGFEEPNTNDSTFSGFDKEDPDSTSSALMTRIESSQAGGQLEPRNSTSGSKSPKSPREKDARHHKLSKLIAALAILLLIVLVSIFTLFRNHDNRRFAELRQAQTELSFQIDSNQGLNSQQTQDLASQIAKIKTRNDQFLPQTLEDQYNSLLAKLNGLSLSSNTQTAQTAQRLVATLTNLNASDVTSGTLANSRLSSSVTLLGNSFNGDSQLVQLTASGILPALDGSQLQKVSASLLGGQDASFYQNASNLSSGTVADGRLSSNIPLKNANNAFSGDISLTGNLGVDTANTANKMAINTANTPDSLAQALIATGSQTNKGLVIQGSLGQSASLQEWQNTNGTALAKVDASGNLTAMSLNTNGAANVDSLAIGTNGIQLSHYGNLLTVTAGSGTFFQQGINVNGNVSLGGYGGSPNQININTPTTAVPNAQELIATGGASNIGLVIQGAASQTSPFQTWEDNSGNILASVGPSNSCGFLCQTPVLTVNGNVVFAGLSVANWSPTTIIGGNQVNFQSAVTAGATLTVTGNATFSGNVVTFSNNVRGYNVPMPSGTSTLSVTFTTAYPDANYAVLCTPSWNTNCYVTNKTTTGFKINTSLSGGVGTTLDWFVAH